MLISLHNASSKTLFRLAECQVNEFNGDLSVPRRFWAKVDLSDGDSCWLWAGACNGAGYGQFSWAARFGRCYPVGAHRVAWELVNGPVQNGLFVLHHCDTPRCCNPSHLFLGTHLDNMRDASRKGRFAKRSTPPTRQGSESHE